MNDDKKYSYAIAVAGFKPENIIRPMYGALPPVREVVLLHTNDKRSLETLETVKKTFSALGVSVTEIPIKDVYDFAGIFGTMNGLIKNKGVPAWVNITAGPSLATLALCLPLMRSDIVAVSYDKETERVVSVNMSSFFKIVERKTKDRELLELIEQRGKMSFAEIRGVLGVSIPTVSRKIARLRSAGVVSVSGAGGRNSCYVVELTAVGHALI